MGLPAARRTTCSRANKAHVEASLQRTTRARPDHAQLPNGYSAASWPLRMRRRAPPPSQVRDSAPEEVRTPALHRPHDRTAQHLLTAEPHPPAAPPRFQPAASSYVAQIPDGRRRRKRRLSNLVLQSPVVEDHQLQLALCRSVLGEASTGGSAPCTPARRNVVLSVCRRAVTCPSALPTALCCSAIGHRRRLHPSALRRFCLVQKNEPSQLVVHVHHYLCMCKRVCGCCSADGRILLGSCFGRVESGTPVPSVQMDQIE